MLGSSEIAESGVKVSSRILRRYVLRGEQVEVATRQHWAKLAEPVFTVILGFFLVTWTSAGLERAFGDFGLYLWWVWFGLIGRLIWRVFEWRNEWFVATDKRLLLTYGLFTHKVAMMPLGKVTDLNYGRSITGRMLGYGDFTLESAGQDQALRKINWLPAPDETYRRICDIIFGPERFDSEDSLGHHDDPSQPDSDQTDFDHHRPENPEPPRRRYTSNKIAADGDGGSLEDWDEHDDESDDGVADVPDHEETEDVETEDLEAVDVDADDVDADHDVAAEDDAEAAHDDDANDDGADDDGADDDGADDDWIVDSRRESDAASATRTANDPQDSAGETTPVGDEPQSEPDDEDDWQIDSRSREPEPTSAWEASEGSPDDSWQTSREGAPAYQQVEPRKHTSSATEDDITGPIRTA